MNNVNTNLGDFDALKSMLEEAGIPFVVRRHYFTFTTTNLKGIAEKKKRLYRAIESTDGTWNYCEIPDPDGIIKDKTRLYCALDLTPSKKKDHGRIWFLNANTVLDILCWHYGLNKKGA